SALIGLSNCVEKGIVSLGRTTSAVRDQPSPRLSWDGHHTLPATRSAAGSPGAAPPGIGNSQL
ncbi:MAG: hypothetical protein WB020_09410, partial [Candidatus Dormiibacterota bacterium]